MHRKCCRETSLSVEVREAGLTHRDHVDLAAVVFLALIDRLKVVALRLLFRSRFPRGLLARAAHFEQDVLLIAYLVDSFQFGLLLLNHSGRYLNVLARICAKHGHIIPLHVVVERLVVHMAREAQRGS